jgi:hypothetical protein
MKTSKIKLLIGFIVFFALGTVNCSDDWLLPQPLSIFTPESVLTDSRGFYGLLSACERNEREEYYGDGNAMHTELIFSDMCVQGQTNRMGAAQNMNLSITPTSQLRHNRYNMIGWFWQEFYEVIKWANVVINRIDDAEWHNEAERNQVLGSAYFHRSYCYYRMTQQFGDVPFIGREIQGPKLDFYSTKREVILEKIKKDMEFAVQWCSDDVDRGRATRGACYHLLTLINLALGDFDDAIASANGVINGGVYSLMTTPFGEIPQEPGSFLRDQGIIRDDIIARLHWPANKALPENKEVLYMFISRDELPSSRSRTSLMRHVAPFWSNTSSFMLYTPDGKGPGTSASLGCEIDLVETFGRGYGNMRLTWWAQRTVWDDPNDLRHKKGNWINMEDLVYNSPSLQGVSAYYGQPLQRDDAEGNVLTGDTIMNWHGWPHYKGFAPDPLNSRPDGGYADIYCYRLADTYLLRAEAYWWKGDQVNAMADINAVRTRAGCDPYTDPSKIDIGTVLDERARELYYEEPRKTELTRISYLLAQTGKSYNGKTYTMENFGTDNFFYDRIMEKNDFYNKGVVNISGVEYKISPYHVLWCIPQAAISANTEGVINQNYGYDGYELRVPPLEVIDPEDDN